MGKPTIQVVQGLSDIFTRRYHLDRGIAVAIDGVVYRDDWTQKIPGGAEVFLMPRIEGG